MAMTKCFQKPEYFFQTLLQAKHLREVHLYLNQNNIVNQVDIDHFTTEFPHWLEVCKTLSKLNVRIPVVAWSVVGPDRKRILGGLVTRIRKKIDVRGQFTGASGDRLHEEADV